MSTFGLDGAVGPLNDVWASWESLELKYADPRRRTPFRSWRMNRTMPPPRTVKETSRIRACCWIRATNACHHDRGEP